MRRAVRSIQPKMAIWLVGVPLIVFAALQIYLALARGHTGSRVDKVKADFRTLEAAIGQFWMDCDRKPTTDEGLGALIHRPKGAIGWHGPYIRTGQEIDPWGRPYLYEPESPNDGLFLETYGADGLPGGTGENADIIFDDQ